MTLEVTCVVTSTPVYRPLEIAGHIGGNIPLECICLVDRCRDGFEITLALAGGKFPLERICLVDRCRDGLEITLALAGANLAVDGRRAGWIPGRIGGGIAGLEVAVVVPTGNPILEELRDVAGGGIVGVCIGAGVVTCGRVARGHVEQILGPANGD